MRDEEQDPTAPPIQDKPERSAGRRRRSPEAAREEILAAAQALLAEHGPDAVGLKEVAHAAGVSHGLITHYFGTYDKLVDAVIARYLGGLSSSVVETLQAEDYSPPTLFARIFQLFNQRGHIRLMTWVMLSGRLFGPETHFAKVQGLRRVVDALHQRRAAAFALLGSPAPAREDTELAVLTAVSAMYGYSLGKDAFWIALGQDGSAPERDARLGEWLRILLMRHLLPGF